MLSCLLLCLLGPAETCLESDQKISEQLPPPSEVSQTLIDDSRLKEDNIKESPSIPESQESSEASVTGSNLPAYISG